MFDEKISTSDFLKYNFKTASNKFYNYTQNSVKFFFKSFPNCKKKNETPNTRSSLKKILSTINKLKHLRNNSSKEGKVLL